MSETHSVESGGLDLADRGPIYAWLSRLLALELDGEEWEGLRLEPVRSILVRLDRNLGDELARPLTSSKRETYAEEFARLFLLPAGVSPFASSWIGESDVRDRTRDEIAAFIDRVYRAVEREPIDAEPWGRLPRDHIAVILDLVAEAQRSTAPGDREVAAHLDRELLGPWIARFGRVLGDRARVPFYRALGRLIAALHSND